MPSLFDPISLGNLEIKNRIMLSPMCQYMASNKRGVPESWHYVHLVSRAVGGTGLIMTEMTDVEPRGRITEVCLGLYNREQMEAFQSIVKEVHRFDAKIGVQLAHAGRKSVIEGGDIVAPSAVPFSAESPVPRELTEEEITSIVAQFTESAKLAVEAGFDTIELHGAHGYLLHQFMSPASNKRTDKYGELERFPLEVIKAVKSVIPKEMPLIFRVSAVEYSDGGYSFSDILKMCQLFIEAGVDVFDISTGGDSPNRPEVFPAYQVPYAEKIKKELNVPVISVGKLEDPNVAEAVIRQGQADMICIGKGMLKNPYWAKEAAETLGKKFNLPGVYDQGF